MKVDDYELLLKLHEVGTIRGTARQVLISQPAITQRLKFMEDYFGEKIFVRTSRKLLLTPAGELILEHARKVMESEQDIKNRLARSSDDVRGTLSLACSTLISQRFLPRVLATYTAHYPHVSIDLVTGISEDIKREHHNYHLSIIRGDRLKEIDCDHLFADPLLIFDTEPFPQHQLKKRPLISFKTDDKMNEAVDHWMYHHQDHIQPEENIHVDQIETCRQFMKQGLGMAVLPQSVSGPLMDDYPHMVMMLDGENVTRDTWICYQKENRELPQVDKFIEVLENQEFPST